MNEVLELIKKRQSIRKFLFKNSARREYAARKNKEIICWNFMENEQNGSRKSSVYKHIM